MDCLIKTKKDKKIIIWTLDGSPKFYQVEFNNIELYSNFNLKIIWNRPIKGVTTNSLIIKFSYANVFFEEKTVSVNQFKLEYQEIINTIFKSIKNQLILQGFVLPKQDDVLSKVISKYIKSIFKYIDKKLKNKGKKDQMLAFS